MTDSAIHPVYQFRYVDGEGLSMIVEAHEIGPLIEAGRSLQFGYWRPHAFN